MLKRKKLRHNEYYDMQHCFDNLYAQSVNGQNILTPLLSNIVLNELDWWVSNQWETFKSNHPYKHNGSKVQALKKSNLKECYIVRYADDFKVLCRTRS